jgi:hypothetical protein
MTRLPPFLFPYLIESLREGMETLATKAAAWRSMTMSMGLNSPWK